MKILLLSLALLVPGLPAQADASFFHYLVESARQGEAESQFILGMTYCDGWEGVVRAGTVTARWCELAAELGDKRPEFVFGLLQRGQERVKPDRVEAIKWLTAAADQGDDYARVILGEMLLEGDGVPADWRHGVEWMRKSAAAGFAPAQFRLGIVYLIGDATTPKNPVEALAWFIVAAEAGSKSALEFRDEQTELLGREIARLAVLRSRILLRKS
jgi:TPR repeat protein